MILISTYVLWVISTIWTTTREKKTELNANNKCAQQPFHPSRTACVSAQNAFITCININYLKSEGYFIFSFALCKNATQGPMQS